jgi:hypothetical protein
MSPAQWAVHANEGEDDSTPERSTRTSMKLWKNGARG